MSSPSWWNARGAPRSAQRDAVGVEDVARDGVEDGVGLQQVDDGTRDGDLGLLELLLAQEHVVVRRASHVEARLLGREVLLGVADGGAREFDARARRAD